MQPCLHEGPVFMLGVGEGNGACQLPCFPSPPTSNMLRNQYEPICLPFAAHPPLHSGIVYIAVFMLPLCAGCCLFRGASQLSLTLLACPGLSRLTFKALGSKSHSLYKLKEFIPSVFKSQMLRGLVQACFSAVSGHTAPSLLWAASLCLSDLPNLSDAASLHLVVG